MCSGAQLPAAGFPLMAPFKPRDGSVMIASEGWALGIFVNYSCTQPHFKFIKSCNYEFISFGYLLPSGKRF